MAKKKTATEIKAEAKAIREATEEKKKALDGMADVEARERDLLGEDDAAPTPTDVPEPEPTKLDFILAEIKGDGFFTVAYMSGAGEHKMGQWPISDYPDQLEVLARQKGGGTFKVQFRNGDGHYKGQMTRSFDKDSYAGFKTPEAVPTNGHGADNSGLTQVLEVMMKAQQQQTTMMVELFKAQNQGGGLMKSASDVVAIAKLFQGEKKSPFSELREMVSMLNSLKEEAEEDTPLERTIDKVFGVLGPLLEAGAARLGATQAAGGERPALPAPDHPGGPPRAAAPASPPTKEQQVIAAYCQHLKHAITGGAPPGATATIVVASCSKEQDRRDLYDFCSNTENLEKMVAYDHQLSSHIQWLTEFMSEVVDNLDEMARPVATEVSEEGPEVVADPRTDEGATDPVPEPEEQTADAT